MSRVAAKPLTRLWEQAIPGPGAPLELAGANARILAKVLRAREGDSVTLLDGKGHMAGARVLSLTSKSARVRVEDKTLAPKPVPSLILLQAVPKGSKAAGIVQDAVEWGADRVVFLESRRTIPRGARESSDRWHCVAVEALRQSGNPYLPGIEGPCSVKDAVEKHPAELSLLFDERPESPGMKAFGGGTPASVRVAVGPEGGWSDEEREFFLQHGFRPVHLGPYVLRTDTAAVSALAVCRAWF
jgi:16S rRNA (uracil1498-N3)-methyltransferase